MKRCLPIFLLWALMVGTAGAADERIWLDGTINGQPLRYIFDTGMGFPLVLFPATAKRLGLEIVSRPTDKPAPGMMPVALTEPCRVGFGKEEFTAGVGVVDIPKYFKFHCDGVVGWPAITNNLWSLDLAGGGVVSLPALPAGIGNWTKLSLRTDASILALGTTAPGGGKETLLIDTGSSDGVILAPAKWKEWKRAHTNQPVTLTAYYTPSLGLVVKEQMWADHLALGPLVFSGVPVQEADANNVVLGTLPHATYLATLGLAALKRLEVLVDGSDGVAYLRPKPAPAPVWKHNRLGAVFVPATMADNDLVAHVAPGTPAYEAGIRDGDVLLKIDNLDVTPWRTDPNILPLSRFWENAAGVKFNLTLLRRGDKVFTATPVLRNLLPPDAAVKP